MTELYYFALSFFVYGFLGWCTEVAYAAAKQGKFVNRGFLNGPICPVYGIGVGVVVQFLTPVENNLVLLYISSTILVTVIEGITGFLLEKIFHNKWWDYSEQPLNIGGYKYDKKQKHFLYLSTMISRMILVILQNTKIILQATID